MLPCTISIYNYAGKLKRKHEKRTPILRHAVLHVKHFLGFSSMAKEFWAYCDRGRDMLLWATTGKSESLGQSEDMGR